MQKWLLNYTNQVFLFSMVIRVKRFVTGGCKLQVAGCRCRLQVQVAGAGCRLRVAGLFCWARLLVRVVSWVIKFHQVCSAGFILHVSSFSVQVRVRLDVQNVLFLCKIIAA